ncbi:hypothetical protein V7S43_003414 [Phytophthora oleae]|uniref:Tudor domain-containing protein n=1 Tax=Phytophthora oleae TaxID=2107226 RepID=A0ABD3FX39_9STRA
MTSRMSNPVPPSQQFNARQPQDVESFTSKLESPSRYASGSSRPSSAAKRSGRLQVHDGAMSTSTQEIPAVAPRRSWPSTPAEETNENPRVHSNEIPTPKPALPPKKVPLSPIRQLSERIKVHDDGALPTRAEASPKGAIPILPIRQPSNRLQVHGDGTVTIRKDSSVTKPIESVARAPDVLDTMESTDQSAKHPLDHQLDDNPHFESNHDHGSDIPDIPSSSATEPEPHTPISRFTPLHSQWTYGQRIFGRYKKTPYFYSGNIATYLGAGMFMVVFDDGTLDYRVRREDIMLREHPSAQQKNSSQRTDSGSFRRDSFGREEAEDVINSKSRRKSQQKLGEETEEYCLDSSVAPEMYLPPLQHVMVDFSVTPPKEMVLSFDDSGVAYVVGLPGCGSTQAENETWRLLLDDETLTMKRLECGVGYEDDSTQVSDSDESSEDDMLMTPWQQMTQTFGMGKATRAQRGTGRRSSISSVSQVDRLSVTHKGMKKIIPTPKSLKQVITEYFLRGNKKVQPSKPTDELASAEHIRLMEAKLNMMRSTRCNAGSPKRGECDSIRVVYERSPEGVRAYGTVSERVEDGSYAVVTEDEHGISVQVLPQDMVDFLPSVNELEQQLTDLERSQRVFFAGQRVQVSLYPGSRFSGRGLITLEREYQSRFHVLLANRIRLVNIPVEKISPLLEKKRTAVTITEDQFLVCSNKVKVYIGDQIYVKCSAGNGDLDSTCEEEKLGLLNGVYSNKTAAVDFADGSTGYEIPPQLIFKRKRLSVPADQDVRSLKNAVLMQASAAAHGGGIETLPVLEEGYQVKADHPRKAAVESCIVIKTHHSSACDLRFSDGTIAFEVFPSQMIIDSVEHQRTTNTFTNESSQYTPVYAVGDYVLAWSSRFGRYCSAKIVAKTSQDPTNGPASLSSPTVHTIVIASVQTTLYTVVFDYGEQKAHVPPDKITSLDDMTALYHTQRLTNYSIDAMGFELSSVNFAVGESVMGRVHGSARYFNGVVEAVDEKERVCAVCFDSSERDTAVPFSAMFSVDSRPHFVGRSSSTKQVGSGASSSSGAASRAQYLSRQRVTDTTEANARRRRNSSGSVGNMLKSVADNFFRSSRSKRNLDTRRGSHMITEIGARLRLEEQ